MGEENHHRILFSRRVRGLRLEGEEVGVRRRRRATPRGHISQAALREETGREVWIAVLLWKETEIVRRPPKSS